MSMITTTFIWAENSGLTVSAAANKMFNHKTDQSDNPQPYIRYLGSLGSGGSDTADRQLQADSDPGVDPIEISIEYILPDWDATTAYSLGDCIAPGDGYRYRCVEAGTSGGSKPTFNNTVGQDTVDNTVIWRCVSTIHDVTEVTLAETAEDLDTNTPGVPLNLGHTITSGTANKKTIYIKVENSVLTPSNNFACPELRLIITPCSEGEVP